jgi:hypothetical protein
MNACKTIFVLLMLALAGVMASKPAAAQADYQFTVIDGPGSFGTNVYGISNNGLVSGTYLDAAGFNHGFVICNFKAIVMVTGNICYHRSNMVIQRVTDQRCRKARW